MFYDNSILPGTKILQRIVIDCREFYDNSILPATKIAGKSSFFANLFYDNSILPGTKMLDLFVGVYLSFTITQFFQVLKF